MRAVLFDVDDTLYDQAYPLLEAYHSIFSDEIDIAELLRQNVKYSHKVFEAARQGRGTMKELYRERAKNCMRAFGKEISDEMAAKYQATYMESQKKIFLSETIQKLLDFCVERKIPIGIITNGMSDHQREKIEILQLERWFQEKDIFVSGDIQIDKPDRRIFEWARKKMGLENIAPEEIFYVGDSPDKDIVGAKQAGWSCIWFNRRGESLRKEQIQPDYVVETEEELRKQVEILYYR